MSPAAPITAPLAATGPPVLSEANAPAAVRHGSAAVKQAYASARGFEEMLLQQLSSSLVQSSGLSAEGEPDEEGSPQAGGEAGGGMLSALLPQTLTEGVTRGGGLGLAEQLMGALDPAGRSSIGRSALSGSSAAGAVGPTGGASSGSPAGVPSGAGSTGGTSA